MTNTTYTIDFENNTWTEAQWAAFEALKGVEKLNSDTYSVATTVDLESLEGWASAEAPSFAPHPLVEVE